MTPVAERPSDESEGREDQALDGEWRSGQSHLVLVLAHQHRQLERVWEAVAVGLPISAQREEGLEEVLRPECGPDLASDADLIRPGIPPSMWLTGRHHGHVASSKGSLLTVDQHGQRPGHDFESLFLLGMDVRRRHESTGWCE